MERIYRIIFLGLFILGFVGAVASADHNFSTVSDAVGVDLSPNGAPEATSDNGSLIRDIRLAEEVNSMNEGRWNQDVTASNQDGLARVEAILNQ